MINNHKIEEESTSINTGEISTPKAFDKKVDEALPKTTGTKTNSKIFIPKAFEFPKELLNPIEGKKHFKLATNDNGESILSISPEIYTALDYIERGRTSFDKEQKLPALTRWVKDKVPQNIRGLIKKHVGNSKTSDGYFVTSLMFSQNNPEDAHKSNKKINITDKGINILKKLKADPDSVRSISPEVVQLLVYLYKNKNSEITLNQFVEDSGMNINSASKLVNGLTDFIKSIDLGDAPKSDKWWVINPFGGNTNQKVNNPLYEIIKSKLIKEATYKEFKQNVTYRTKSEQLHKAIREVKQKLQEIDRIVEYTSRMKQELSEGEEGIRYWKSTQKNVAKISEMVNHLNNKLKNLNE